MENLKRSVRIFFATYGGLLFRIIGGIILIIVVLRGINSIVKENNKPSLTQNNIVSQNEKEDREKKLEIQQENKKFVSEFIDYCNDNKIQEAYKMLSKECINKKYPTIEKFKSEYINKIFTYKKEYKITEENGLYKVEVLEGILQSGKIEDRDFIETYFKIEESILGKKIYIER